MIWSKKRIEYVEYGMCPGFTIWKNGGSCMQGHMIIKKSDTKEEISYKLIELITKMCRENNISVSNTMKTINENLINNDLL